MMPRLRTRLSRLFTPDGFRGPVLTLLSGSAVALGLAYLTLPILTRLYPPEAWGISDYFISILVVLMTFASLRYEDALMLPERDDEAAGVLWLASTLVLLTAGACLLVLPWRVAFAAALGVPGLAPWLPFVPPTLLAMRWAKLAELWLTRERRFAMVTAGQVVNTAAMVSARLGAGITEAGAGGLIGGYALGQLAAVLLYAGALIRRSTSALRSGFRPRHWVTLARRFRRFPAFSMPATLLNTFVARLPYLLVPLFFDAAVLGLLGRAFAALAIPLSFVGEAVAKVFFVEAANATRTGDLPRLTQTIHARLVMIGLFPTLALVVAGQDVLAFVLGEAWRDAGLYLRYLAPWLFLAAVASPLTRLFDVLERQRLDLTLSLVMFAVLLAALMAGGLRRDVILLLLLLGAAGVLVRVLHLSVLLRIACVPLSAALRAYGRYFLFSLPGLALLAAALPLEKPWLTTLAALGGGLVYAALVLWRDQLLMASR